MKLEFTIDLLLELGEKAYEIGVTIREKSAVFFI